MSSPTITCRNIHAAPGIQLDDRARTLVGLTLDLFQGKCTWAKLQYFTDDGVYLDAFADAKGRDQVGGQFFGLPIVTQSSITKEHLVLRADDQQIDYRMIHEFHFSKAFLLGQTVTFSTLVSLELQDGKIKKLSDRPEGDLPSDTVTKAMRDLNSVVAPKLLPFPTNEQEDEKWWRNHVLARPEQEEREREQGGPEGKPAEQESKRG